MRIFLEAERGIRKMARLENLVQGSSLYKCMQGERVFITIVSVHAATPPALLMRDRHI